MNWETILCLGDSITIGARSYLGYPEYCGQYLSQKTSKKWNVINHSVSGYTTIDLVRSIDKDIAHLKAYKPELIIVLIGTNDLKSNTTPENFKIAYEQLITKAQLISGSKNIVLLSIPKLLDGVMLPYKIDMNKMINTYNEIIRDLAKQDNLISFAIEPTADEFYDGVHLNDLGSKVWGEKLAEMILKLRTA